MFAYGSVSRQLFPVVWVFLRSQGVICYDRWVLNEGHKNYFKDWCLMNSQPTFLFFNLFKLNELWPYYQKHVHQIILNCKTLWSLALWIFEAYVWILLIVNLSLNQTLLTFFWVRQTWLTQLILALSLWKVIFNSKGFWYSYVWSCSLCERRTSFCTRLISRKLCRFLFMFSTGFTSLSVLLLFPLLITFFSFVHGFWFYFI